ncbi:uncharacterized protein LOC5508508 isoform X2 [Nematostella vectensis]|uniref:uncharacterized protein LOC5508508 isoform X2 n=1 Tax=Nematostella vectensis TaxID=45351 RepID=UPI00138FDE14|nr:uncharacterized protein LOC5508508 isoform X2 [Nematostella vectensis]
MSLTTNSMAEESSATNDSFSQGTDLYTDFTSTAEVKSEPTEATDFTASAITSTDPSTSSSTVSGEGQEKSKPNHNKREEWLDKDDPLHCKVCDFKASDMQAFQNHSLSVRHIKRAAEVFEIKFNLKKDEEKEKKKTEFHCQVCLCSCNSESAWNSHLVGQKHRKNLEKQGADKAHMKAKQKMGPGGYGASSGGYGTDQQYGGGAVRNTYLQHNRKPYEKPVHAVANPTQSGPVGAKDFMNYKEPLIGLEYVTEIQVTGQSPRYHCELCDSKFDHNLKFPHLVGAKHRFNVLKEKCPEVATAVRSNVKKRSELTGRLLDEAYKLEQKEGRKQVKTRVEASPYSSVNQTSISRTSIQNTMGRGQGSSARGQGVSGRGRGARGNHMRGGQTNNSYGHRGNSNTGYKATNPQQYDNNSQQSYGDTRGRGRGMRGQPNDQGRGGRGRGWHQSSQSQQYPSLMGSSYQRRSYAPNDTYAGSSQSNSLLPREAFHPQQESQQQHYNYNQSYSHPYSYQPASQQQTSVQRDHGASYANPSTSGPPPYTAPPTSGTQQPAPRKSNVANQEFIKGLGELGKLVSSEEDASVALQVSNVLTQALLQYRMQNLPSSDEVC